MEKLSLILLVITMILSGNVLSANEINKDSQPFSFSKEPFIHPQIISDLQGWYSDTGTQITSINLAAGDSNRYSEEAIVTKTEDGA